MISQLPSLLLVVLTLAATGTWLYLAARGVQRVWNWILRKLWMRYLKTCGPLNQQWRGRCVRHGRTGRVGICTGVCLLKKFGPLVDPLFPIWMVEVTTCPELAALEEMGAPPWRGPFEFASTVIRRANAFDRLTQNPDAQMRVPLAEMNLAPSGDAAAFREKMILPEDVDSELFEGGEQE